MQPRQRDDMQGEPESELTLGMRAGHQLAPQKSGEHDATDASALTEEASEGPLLEQGSRPRLGATLMGATRLGATLMGRLRRIGTGVWQPVLLKTLALGCALACVAWFGDRSRDADTYGEPLLDEALPSERSQQAFPLTLASAGAPAREPGGPGQSGRSQRPAAAGSEAARIDGEPKLTPCEPEASDGPKGILPDGRVILNEATAQELTTLKGVGEKRAQSIVELRERLGRFRKVSDLLRVRGIGWKSLQKLKEQLVLERPEPSANDAETAPAPGASAASAPSASAAMPPTSS